MDLASHRGSGLSRGSARGAREPRRAAHLPPRPSGVVLVFTVYLVGDVLDRVFYADAILGRSELA